MQYGAQRYCRTANDFDVLCVTQCECFLGLFLICATHINKYTLRRLSKTASAVERRNGRALCKRTNTKAHARILTMRRQRLRTLAVLPYGVTLDYMRFYSVMH